MKKLVVLLLCCGGAFAQSRTAVVITETSDWKTSPTVGGHSESHLADVTLDMSRSCPDLVVTTDSSKAQFGLRIDHQQRDANNGVLALFDKPYTYIVYSSTGEVLDNARAKTISKAVKEVCKFILANSSRPKGK